MNYFYKAIEYLGLLMGLIPGAVVAALFFSWLLPGDFWTHLIIWGAGFILIAVLSQVFGDNKGGE